MESERTRSRAAHKGHRAKRGEKAKEHVVHHHHHHHIAIAVGGHEKKRRVVKRKKNGEF